MKLLIVLCCVVSVSWALPGMFNRRESTPNVAEVIQKTISTVNKRRTIEKRTDGVELAFKWIDADSNGHINGDEFSTFYAPIKIEGKFRSKSTWLTLFNQFMTIIDTNGNNQLEIGEFRTLSEIGE
ncbi:uncharacterized protein [Mytilus edulis]|uniref:uncharacterized protein n=1 Tax=Mytilus edulis TaxID=6550 RepID=UPI0039EE480D